MELLTKNNTMLIDALAEAIGLNQLLDEVLNRLEADTFKEVISSIMDEHGLELPAK